MNLPAVVKGLLRPVVRRYRVWQRRRWYAAQCRDIAAQLRQAGARALVLCMTPLGRNLGDHAIVLAERAWLRADFPDYTVIEIPNAVWILDRQYRRLPALLDGRPLLCTGGGNVGTLWLEDCEYVLRHIVQSHPHSPIVVLPNSAYYAPDAAGQRELQRTREVFNAHPALHLFWREALSYALCQQHFAHCYLTPDMVLYTEGRAFGHRRRGALLCLREDSEKVLGAADEALLRTAVPRVFDRVDVTDMYAPQRQVLPADRQRAVQDKLEQFSQYELVITDRLHAMIFCALTGTPCIAIRGKSPKLEGCYAWLEPLGYIRLIAQADQWHEAWACLDRRGGNYDCVRLRERYAPLTAVLEELLKGMPS